MSKFNGTHVYTPEYITLANFSNSLAVVPFLDFHTNIHYTFISCELDHIK